MAEYTDVFPFHKVEVNTPTTITEDIYTDLVILEQNNLPNGEYMVSLTYDWELPDKNDSAIFRLNINDVDGSEYRREPKDANDREVKSICFPVTVSTGAIKLEFEGKLTTGAADGVVDRSALAIWRVA